LICPKCKEFGQKSTVSGGYGTSTAMYCQPYYDEDGKYHNHDSNSKSFQYSCSKGHLLFVSPSNRCSNCDWGHEETITVADIPLVENNNILILPSGGGTSEAVLTSSGTWKASNKGE